MLLKFFKPAMGIIALALVFTPAFVTAAAAIDITMVTDKVFPPAGTNVWYPATNLDARKLNAVVRGQTIVFTLINLDTERHTFRVTEAAPSQRVLPSAATLGKLAQAGKTTFFIGDGVGIIVESGATVTDNTAGAGINLTTTEVLNQTGTPSYFCSLHKDHRGGQFFVSPLVRDHTGP